MKTKMNKERLDIGDIVSFKICYPRKCSNRFPYSSTLTVGPIKKEGNWVGHVVGIRNIIMSNYKVHRGSIDFENGIQDCSYATGKKEMVYLVTTSIYKEPVIVREEDIL
jgi:hypothetical protein